MINLSLTARYVPQSFKVAVIKPTLKKPTLDPEVLANYKLISILLFLRFLRKQLPISCVIFCITMDYSRNFNQTLEHTIALRQHW